MSAVGMTKGIKLSLLKCLLSECPQIVCSKIALVFNSRKQKTGPSCEKLCALPCHPVGSKSSHSPNPHSCFPLNSP